MKTKIFFALALLALLFTSCDKDSRLQTEQPQALNYQFQNNKKPMYALAHLDGDPDSVQAIGNYSGDTVWFVFKAPPNDYISVNRVMVGIEDVNIGNTDQYGGATALNNGIRMTIRDVDSVLISTLTPYPIKSNGEWAEACHDMVFHNLGNGDDYISIRWTFGNAGHPINLSPGQFICVEMFDDMSGLVNHQFFFQGYYQDETY